LYAIASDILIGWGGVDKHVDIVQYVATETTKDGSTVWGGYHPEHKGALAGSTKERLGDVLTNDQLFDGIVVAAGGGIAQQEAAIAYARNLKMLLLECAPKNAVASCAHAMGPVGEWMTKEGLTAHSGT
jgi:hypothetical protein